MNKLTNTTMETRRIILEGITVDEFIEEIIAAMEKKVKSPLEIIGFNIRTLNKILIETRLTK